MAFIRSAAVDEYGVAVMEETPDRYKREEEVDLEDGEIHFTRSFATDGFEWFVYINTEGLYASEFERLSLGEPKLGINCDMNDVDGDYYEFEV